LYACEREGVRACVLPGMIGYLVLLLTPGFSENEEAACASHGMATLAFDQDLPPAEAGGRWIPCTASIDNCLGRYYWQRAGGTPGETRITNGHTFAAKLCSHLESRTRSRNLLLLGDSISLQFYHLLGILLWRTALDTDLTADEASFKLWGHAAERNALPATTLSALIAQSVCNGSTILGFIRNDWLDAHRDYPAASAHKRSDHSFLCAHTWRQLDKTSVQVLNNFTYLCGNPASASIRSRLFHAKGSNWAQLVVTDGLSCGNQKEPCAGCRAKGDVRTLCDTVGHARDEFCTAAAAARDWQPSPGGIIQDEWTSPFGDPARCVPWADPTFLKPWGVVVANTGPHQVPIGQFNQAVCRAANLLSRHAANTGAVVAFRTTVPTFNSCHMNRNSPPFLTLAAAEAYNREHLHFNHGHFVRLYNHIAASHFQRLHLNVIDAYTPSIMRTDDREGMIKSEE